jgi:hypothetical protein
VLNFFQYLVANNNTATTDYTVGQL